MTTNSDDIMGDTYKHWKRYETILSNQNKTKTDDPSKNKKVVPTYTSLITNNTNLSVVSVVSHVGALAWGKAGPNSGRRALREVFHRLHHASFEIHHLRLAFGAVSIHASVPPVKAPEASMK